MTAKYSVPKSKSWQMFNDISARYDLLNRLLSFGLDIHWRNSLSKKLRLKENMKVLDLATGTGDVIITFVKDHDNIVEGHGLDMAEKMLAIGRSKIKDLGLDKKITLHEGDANQIPFEEGMFANTSIAFGIRNVSDPSVVLKEMYRVLEKEGRTLILEFSMPKNILIRFFHIFYLRYCVPVIGFIFSGNYKAYKYLNQTIETFPYGKAFCDLMRSSGFTDVKQTSLLFGTATIYQGSKS